MLDTGSLSTEQQFILDRTLQMKSGLLVVIGKAGVGKSRLIGAIVEKATPVICAPTGLASLLVGGQTTYSFFGLKPGPLEHQGPNMSLDSQIALECCSHLIIDEGFMVRVDMLDKIDEIMRHYLTDEPFGGKPVIIFGDPFQIEPVVKWNELEDLNKVYQSRYIFDSKAFKEANPEIYELVTVFRQTDPEFKEALDKVRLGDHSGLAYFDGRVARRNWSTLSISLTNQGASYINLACMAQIESEPARFVAKTYGAFYNELPVPEILELKVGARVMVCANTQGCVNGDMGTVIACENETVTVQIDRGYPVKFEPNRWERIKYEYNEVFDQMDRVVVGSYSQIPLKFAWAVTTHKGQGQTYESCHLLLERPSFAHGQTYVALSRCRTADGLTLERKLRPNDLVLDRDVVQWYHTATKALAQ